MTRSAQDAAQLDSAIDEIIGNARGRVAPDEDGLVATARLLRQALPRLHPRFGFEEHLAARLAAARRVELDLAPVAATSAPTPIRPGIEVDPLVEPETEDEHDHRRRNLVAGGAIASGVSLALPIAGAAIVAWRRTRSSRGVF